MQSPIIKDAASLILLRKRAGKHFVLMGQRGENAAFMPNKFVFPGGAVDTGDAEIPLKERLNAQCHQRLLFEGTEKLAHALPVAAIRELWEEAGLILGKQSEWRAPPPDWTDFAERGYCPSVKGFSFVFRAVTPIGPKRRFDARFFLVDANEVAGDIDDFSAASDELSHLQWIEIADARAFDLPFITEVVLAEITKLAETGATPASVPYFKATDKRNIFTHIPDNLRIP